MSKSLNFDEMYDVFAKTPLLWKKLLLWIQMLQDLNSLSSFLLLSVHHKIIHWLLRYLEKQDIIRGFTAIGFVGKIVSLSENLSLWPPPKTMLPRRHCCRPMLNSNWKSRKRLEGTVHWFYHITNFCFYKCWILKSSQLGSFLLLFPVNNLAAIIDTNYKMNWNIPKYWHCFHISPLLTWNSFTPTQYQRWAR